MELGRLTTAVALLVLVGTVATPAHAETKTFEIEASKYAFAPAQLEVDEGDTVVLKLHSTDVAHSLAIKALKFKALIPKGGEVVSAEFVASKPGSYPFTCSEYCGSGHSRMKGTLVVRPKTP